MSESGPASMRQVIHDHMAQMADAHAAEVYPDMEGNAAARLFALLVDVAFAYQVEVEADLADPDPAKSLAALSGKNARDVLLTALDENLEMRDDDPGCVPVNGWLCWRAAPPDAVEEDGE